MVCYCIMTASKVITVNMYHYGDTVSVVTIVHMLSTSNHTYDPVVTERTHDVP